MTSTPPQVAAPNRPPGPRSPRKLAPRRSRPVRWGATAGAVAVVVWAVQGTELRPQDLLEGGAGASALLRGLLSPNLSGEFLDVVWRGVQQTAQISIAGLLLAATVGMPLALLLARNVAAPAAVRAAVRVSTAFLRGVPDLLWALLFVAMLGPGPAAGTLALAVHGAGMLAKLGAEQLEAVKPAPVEGVRLTGASRTAVAVLAVVPEARANLASVLLYQWECNVRTSAVLGFVGAGGIGQELAVSLRLFRYEDLSTLVLAVLVLILGVDLLSRVVRRRLGAAA